LKQNWQICGEVIISRCDLKVLRNLREWAYLIATWARAKVFVRKVELFDAKGAEKWLVRRQMKIVTWKWLRAQMRDYIPALVIFVDETVLGSHVESLKMSR
jgi:hypothetical protein